MDSERYVQQGEMRKDTENGWSNGVVHEQGRQWQRSMEAAYRFGMQESVCNGGSVQVWRLHEWRKEVEGATRRAEKARGSCRWIVEKTEGRGNATEGEKAT